MFQKSHTNHPDLGSPTWPPRPDARYDPVVFDTERRVVLSVDDAAAALKGSGATRLPELDSLASFQPERSGHMSDDVQAARRPEAELRHRLRQQGTAVQQRTGWNLRTMMTGLSLLAVTQAAVIGVLLLRRAPSPDRPPAPASAALAAQADTAAGTTGSTGATDVASAPARVAAVLPSDGRLRVSSTPTGATVLIDGQRRGTAPLTIDSISPGTHRVQVVNGTSTVEQAVTIEAGSVTSLLVPVLPSEGWVDVSSPVALQVFEQGHLLGTSADPVQLKPGSHALELRNDTLGFISSTKVSIKSGELLRLKPTLPDGLLQVNAVPWAHVFVDGQPVGDTPLGTLKAPLGPHEIRFVHPDKGEQVRQVVISASAPTRVSVDFR